MDGQDVEGAASGRKSSRRCGRHFRSLICSLTRGLLYVRALTYSCLQIICDRGDYPNEDSVFVAFDAVLGIPRRVVPPPFLLEHFHSQVSVSP